MYSGDPEFGGETKEYHGNYKDDFITKHHITLSAPKHDSSQSVAPEAVNGHITWGTLKVLFDGVRRVRERWSSDVAVPWMESYWEVLLTEDVSEEDGI